MMITTRTWLNAMYESQTTIRSRAKFGRRLLVLPVLLIGTAVHAQTITDILGNEVITDTRLPSVVYRVSCQGTLANYPATIEGQRYYQPYNAVGDGPVQFVGTIATGSEQATLMYDGYFGPYDGVIRTLQGDLLIGVLENTVDPGLTIYDGRASLGAPTTLGQFLCQVR
jgi:hypothetical protein